MKKPKWARARETSERLRKGPRQFSGFRSKFEQRVAAQLDSFKVAYIYEPEDSKITYVLTKQYVPDFKTGQIYIEAKGYFDVDDRRKHLAIKAQHPEIDIRFVFMNASNLICQGSKTTYADWCDKHGFKWAHKVIPLGWLREIEALSKPPILVVEEKPQRRFTLPTTPSSSVKGS